jgi:hypothetical protein
LVGGSHEKCGIERRKECESRESKDTSLPIHLHIILQFAKLFGAEVLTTARNGLRKGEAIPETTVSVVFGPPILEEW